MEITDEQDIKEVFYHRKLRDINTRWANKAANSCLIVLIVAGLFLITSLIAWSDSDAFVDRYVIPQLSTNGLLEIIETTPYIDGVELDEIPNYVVPISRTYVLVSFIVFAIAFSAIFIMTFCMIHATNKYQHIAYAIYKETGKEIDP